MIEAVGLTAVTIGGAFMEKLIDWLLAGDAAVRWQTMRDLLDAPEQAWQAERQRTAISGWGAQFLALQEPSGQWGGGIYSPKWVSTTYTLLTLCDIGLPGDCEAARRGAELVVSSLLGPTCDDAFYRKLAALDRCIVGMMLRIGINYNIDKTRIEAIVANLLQEMMPDGAWNCRRNRRPTPHHSSFHTTFNVLEGLHAYLAWGQGAQHEAVLAAQQSALSFMLEHHLFLSDKTGEVVNSKFTYFSFPTRWFYDVLRGLSYFALVDAPRDARLQEAMDVLHGRRRKDGTWPVQNKHSGRVFFDMEKTGGPSRWNTLRALRVLRWWNGELAAV
ncbi:MAG: hypothetical protein H6659_06190 [Ardenticatenaceae bacterium]|nr:hypothetical protein [Ardenticatenaceae bacterium]